LRDACNIFSYFRQFLCLGKFCRLVLD
jgi:hypothetical protein